ncbi:DUF2938 domain-containing protein [Sphingobacterium lactis]|uniref:DUF2938 domain-containing protein n=1 Tax=Sphingobacterium lactis TaxID=797291 RepID=UPI003DA6C69C
MNTIVKIIAIGIGATITMDLYTQFLKVFQIKSLDYRFVGRWIAYFPKGKFTHQKIMDSPPQPNELLLGWVAHYFIGISFAFLLILVTGKEWLTKPTLLPALIIGILTTVAPFFLMQPAFGFGIAASKLPDPNMTRMKSIITHSVYGLGLYGSAILIHALTSKF